VGDWPHPQSRAGIASHAMTFDLVMKRPLLGFSTVAIGGGRLGDSKI
jgi:hypothetical protein